MLDFLFQSIWSLLCNQTSRSATKHLKPILGQVLPICDSELCQIMLKPLTWSESLKCLGNSLQYCPYLRFRAIFKVPFHDMLDPT